MMQSIKHKEPYPNTGKCESDAAYEEHMEDSGTHNIGLVLMLLLVLIGSFLRARQRA